MIETKPHPTDSLLDQVRACCKALDDKKAENLKVLDMRGKSSITDFFIIVTGTSAPHLRALSKTAQETIHDLGEEALCSGTGEKSGWSVVDAYDFIIHIFTAETRRFYNLEGLWRDAELIDTEQLLSTSP